MIVPQFEEKIISRNPTKQNDFDMKAAIEIIGNTILCEYEISNLLNLKRAKVYDYMIDIELNQAVSLVL